MSKLKEKQKRKMMMMGNSEGKAPVAGKFDPFVLLKDVEVRKKV